ncbi:MAG: hypothetical protein U5R06_07195 [candidate division KSB1 bacterium]|nr:hypothetical protein [candidate division KSB1 bacterium]
MIRYLFSGSIVILLLLSFAVDPEKSKRALRIAFKRFISILPLFIMVILLTSIVLGFVTESTIQNALGCAANRWTATAVSALLGSFAIMPGFIAFPLGAILRNSGVLYMVISAFTTTLMMVGIITFPIEKAFLGMRVAIVRNILGSITALLVAVATGIAFGEVGF